MYLPRWQSEYVCACLVLVFKLFARFGNSGLDVSSPVNLASSVQFVGGTIWPKYFKLNGIAFSLIYPLPFASVTGITWLVVWELTFNLYATGIRKCCWMLAMLLFSSRVESVQICVKILSILHCSHVGLSIHSSGRTRQCSWIPPVGPILWR